MPINIVLNGSREKIEACSVREFILAKGLVPEVVVVEYNGGILKRDQWNESMLSDGDQLEVVSFVGGG